MRLLPPGVFAATVVSSKNQLEVISRMIEKNFDKAKKDDFLRACNDVDYLKANGILDELVIKLSRRDSVVEALSYFAGKFPRVSGLTDEVCGVYGVTAKVKGLSPYNGVN